MGGGVRVRVRTGDDGGGTGVCTRNDRPGTRVRAGNDGGDTERKGKGDGDGDGGGDRAGDRRARWRPCVVLMS